MALTQQQVVKSLLALRPGEQWHLDVQEGQENNAYPHLIWDDVTTKPTESELEAVWEVEEVREARRLEYPDLKEQLDSLGKTLKYLKDNGTNIGPDGDAWVAALQAVKTNNPLP